MKLPTRALLILACSGAASMAYADDAGLLRCRAVVDAGARLSCYDALEIRGAQTPRASGTGAAPAAAAAVAATPGTAAVSRTQSEFGLESLPGAEVKHIESQINGVFNGWEPGQQIALANGQVWRIADGSRAFYNINNPKVRVERGALGSFSLVIAGVNQTPKVRRVK